MMNIMMFTIYWNYSGMPFKSEQHGTNLRHVGLVAFYWSLAFVIKLSTTFIKAISPDNIGHIVQDSTTEGTSEGKQMFYAICYFALSIICDILPYIISLDSQFMKISTFDLVFKFQQDIEDKNDMENQLAI